MFPPKPSDIFSPEGGCSEGLVGCVQVFLNNTLCTCVGIHNMRYDWLQFLMENLFCFIFRIYSTTPLNMIYIYVWHGLDADLR